MIRKLRRKFIMLSMVALFIMLAVITVSINIVNYNSIVSEADDILELLSENKGEFPTGDSKEIFAMPPGMSPEIPYESRYFVVILDENDRAQQTQLQMIKAVDDDTAREYADRAVSSGRQKGFVDNYRYAVITEDGLKIVVFLDWGRRMTGYMTFLVVSICMTMTGYILFFAIILLFSGRFIKPVAESYEKQKQFITDAGHELKTPLAIINADIDVLQLDIADSEWLEDIKKQTHRMTDLTNDLVLLSRMEETGGSMQLMDVIISDVVEETAESFKLLAVSGGKTFTDHIQPLLCISGNDKALRQLVSILLDNAVKYSDENGNILLKLEKSGRNIVLSVYNTTAHEVPVGSLPMLFERFYRLDQSRNSQTGGNGIGLSIARAVAEAHHGKIQAESADGKSLTISVILPEKI